MKAIVTRNQQMPTCCCVLHDFMTWYDLIHSSVHFVSPMSFHKRGPPNPRRPCFVRHPMMPPISQPGPGSSETSTCWLPRKSEMLRANIWARNMPPNHHEPTTYDSSTIILGSRSGNYPWHCKGLDETLAFSCHHLGWCSNMLSTALLPLKHLSWNSIRPNNFC